MLEDTCDDKIFFSIIFFFVLCLLMYEMQTLQVATALASRNDPL